MRATCLVLAIALPISAAAIDFTDAEEPNRFTDAATVTLEQATGIVRRETGGRVLSATPASKGTARGYKVRVLLDGGRVKTLFVDSRGNLSGG